MNGDHGGMTPGGWINGQPSFATRVWWELRTWAWWWACDRWLLKMRGWHKMPDGSWVPGTIARRESVRQWKAMHGHR